jgi:cell division protein FtsL
MHARIEKIAAQTLQMRVPPPERVRLIARGGAGAVAP